jgi:pyruvate/2-oxoglutarate dehydrogenase complex dihydrolipoamide dehydrogenase (E3) component
VTLIEALDRLAPGEEPEQSEVITRVLEDEGVEVCTSAPLAEVARATPPLTTTPALLLTLSP